MFLRYVNRGWLLLGIVTLATLPFYPRQRGEFIFVIAVIFPTYLITRICSRLERPRLAGAVFSLSVNFAFYGLFLELVRELGASQAFETQATVWMLMALAILFAGVLVDKWAAVALAGGNSILLIASRLLLAPSADPRPSVLVFWWMMAVSIWLYEGTMHQALGRSRTERMERELAEKRARNLIENARDVIFTLSVDGLITSLNPSFEVFMGWPRTGWVGRSYEELVAEQDRARIRDQFERIRLGETLRAFRLHMYTHAGELRVVEMNVSPEVKNGQVVGLLGIARDMTEEQRAEDLLKLSEKRFRALIENSSDAIFLGSAEGLITYASPSITKILGYAPEELVGRQGIELVHPEDQQGLLSALAELLQNPEKMVSVQYRHRHKNGSWRWADAVIRNMLADPNISALVGNYRDITELKRTETELSRQAQNNATMYQLSLQMLTSFNLDQIYEDIRLAVQKMMPCDVLVIALLDESAQEIEDVYLWDRDRRWPGRKYPLGQGLTDFIISSGRTMLVNDWDASHDEATRTNEFGYPGHPVHSVLAVPLIRTKGKSLGMISAQSYSSGAYDTEQERLLLTLANQVSEAIENALLFNDLQRSNIELSRAYNATIEGWSHAMDLRDKETEGHTQRVTELTLNMARSMGLKEEELIQIRRGALLHDIGKLGIPDNILLKSENLTQDEWVVMRKHPVMAYEMLSPIAYLEPALDIPYYHHEKWDGTGYPRGLKGKQIPLAARIFAVADVWDAVTSDRPYRPAWTKEKSLEYIRGQSGKYFDPAVVDTFLALLTAG